MEGTFQNEQKLVKYIRYYLYFTFNKIQNIFYFTSQITTKLS